MHSCSGSETSLNSAFLRFDVQDYYTAHGDDAILVATSVFKTLSIIKYWGGSSSSSSSSGASGSKKGLPSVNLSVAAAKAFLRDALTSKQMRIEIWKGGGKRSNTWKVDRQVSRLGRSRALTCDLTLPGAPLCRLLPATCKTWKTFSSCRLTSRAPQSSWR